jgi:excisionase family DNA binding protein
MRPPMKNPQLTNQTGEQKNQLLTKKQTAEQAQTSIRYLEREIARGRLKALKLSRKLVRIRQSDLDAFLENCATIGGDA